MKSARGRTTGDENVVASAAASLVCGERAEWENGDGDGGISRRRNLIILSSSSRPATKVRLTSQSRWNAQ